MEPWESQDQEDLAEAYYNQPLRLKNRSLNDENTRLKKILRDHGISWSPISAAHLAKHQQKKPGRVTRRSTISSQNPSLPFLPIELQLRILNFAITSDYPIIDPLSKLKPENLTQKEKERSNQIAIHFLCTCRAMHTEGTRILWAQNHFVFTTSEALRHFAELSIGFRASVKSVTCRIIAQYYDDKKRNHYIETTYHPSLKKRIALPIKRRFDEGDYSRNGFRTYSWTQVIDFLRALRAPWDPKQDKNKSRPKLLPGLGDLRIDLINFRESSIPLFGGELHNMACHELGCTLNELMVTGLPFDDAGAKATAELTGLVKDDGLFISSLPAFVQKKTGCQALSSKVCSSRLVRGWKGLKDFDPQLDEDIHFEHAHGPVLPAAPAIPNSPPTPPERQDKTVWKLVPKSRDNDVRSWVEFCRLSGSAVEPLGDPSKDSDWEMDSETDDLACDCCGKLHSDDFYDFLLD